MRLSGVSEGPRESFDPDWWVSRSLKHWEQGPPHVDKYKTSNFIELHRLPSWLMFLRSNLHPQLQEWDWCNYSFLIAAPVALCAHITLFPWRMCCDVWRKQSDQNEICNERVKTDFPSWPISCVSRDSGPLLNHFLPGSISGLGMMWVICFGSVSLEIPSLLPLYNRWFQPEHVKCWG